MRIVLDSNVVIAAFASRGLCVDVFELCVRDHVVLLSGHLADEIHGGFLRKLKMTREAAEKNMDFIHSISHLEKPEKVPADSCRDPGDLLVLGLAVAGKADFVVSGDGDLLILKSFRKIKIISPRGFWETMSKKP